MEDIEINEEKGRMNPVNYITLLLTIVFAIISATLFIAGKPSREEVEKMIDQQVNQRLTRIEKQIDDVQTDVKELLARKVNE